MNDAMVFGDRSSDAGEARRADSRQHDPLDVEGILVLLAYEQTHGKRAAVVQALTARLQAVRNGREPGGPLGEYLPRPLAG